MPYIIIYKIGKAYAFHKHNKENVFQYRDYRFRRQSRQSILAIYTELLEGTDVNRKEEFIQIFDIFYGKSLTEIDPGNYFNFALSIVRIIIQQLNDINIEKLFILVNEYYQQLDEYVSLFEEGVDRLAPALEIIEFQILTEMMDGKVISLSAYKKSNGFNNIT